MEGYPALYVPASDLLASLQPKTPNRFVAGRSTRANLCVQDVAWSREQFAVQVEQGVYYLEQMSQKVPTLVNGARLEARHRLKHGDRITVSSTELVFLDHADPKLRKLPDAPQPIEEDEGLTRKAETDA